MKDALNDLMIEAINELSRDAIENEIKTLCEADDERFDAEEFEALWGELTGKLMDTIMEWNS